MKFFSIVIMLFSAFLVGGYASNSRAVSDPELAAYKMPRTHVAPIKDSKEDWQYELYIKLPEEYSENTDIRYPVIYTTDAEVHMDMLSGATEFLMPNVILVGISYQTDHADERANASRFRDYTVSEYANPEIQARFQGGQAGHHLNFIRNEVMPFVDANYRTIPEENTYFGYSLGGAFGAFILFAQPDNFKHYILGSPAFSEASLEFVDRLEAKTAPQKEAVAVNVFVSLGELEERSTQSVGHFMDVLRRRDQSILALTGLEVIENSNHGTAFPKTVIRGVEWLVEKQGS